MNLDSPPTLGSMLLLSYLILTNTWKGRYYSLQFTNEKELLEGSITSPALHLTKLRLKSSPMEITQLMIFQLFLPLTLLDSTNSHFGLIRKIIMPSIHSPYSSLSLGPL